MLEAVAAELSAPVGPELLAGLPTAEVTLTLHGKTQVCTGALLADVAARMGAPSRGDLRGPALMTAIVAEARDGYRVAFTLGEIDPLLGNARIVLADRCDGALLGDADGPYRLAVPGDLRGARSVRQLRTLRLTSLP